MQKPARYTGNEWNTIRQDHDSARGRMVLAFPDLYEVGMSNLGLKIIYDIVNNWPGMLLERVFAPASDMEDLMREYDLLLFALESGKPVRSFDLLGFSLQHELSYTNVLNMLDLAGIPLYSEQRGNDDPLVIGGGPCAYNPEPLAPFFDLFFVGEGEEALPEILEITSNSKGLGLPRREVLLKLAGVAGVYIPAFYRPLWREGKQVALEKIEPAAPDRIKKRFVAHLENVPFPTAPPVSYIQVVHDRAVIELFRGCGRGCRFCQAGHVYRPVRKRSLENIIKIADKLINETGYEELSLSSLSSSDYPGIGELLEELSLVFSKRRVKCSLPSLRLDTYSIKLAEQLHQGKRSSLTFAPEAATERLRSLIGKNISEEEIFSALKEAIEAGWQGFKLYFMIGLPGENDEDVLAIVTLCRKIRDYLSGVKKGRLRLNVSVGTFVPKAHTPFQYVGQLDIGRIKTRQQMLLEGFKSLPAVDYSWHDPESSLLEAVFARGDRSLAPILEEAWRRGCRFDGWSDHFTYSRWQAAFESKDFDPRSYARRSFTADGFLPWDHIECGTSRAYMHKTYQSFTAGLKSARDEEL